jgi:hypothetical protein
MNRSQKFVLGGAIFGVMVVRTFLFDPVESMAWSMFWAALFEGNLIGLDALLESTTFWKVAGGALYGGILGLGASGRRVDDSDAPGVEPE